MNQAAAKDLTLGAPYAPVAPPVPDAAWLDVTALVAWVVSFSVGLLGFALHYPNPAKPLVQPPPVEAQLLRVELTPEREPLSLSVPDSKPLPPSPPAALPDLPAVATAEDLTPLAEPNPSVAFSLPVEPASRTVERTDANLASVSPARSANTNASAVAGISPAVESLVFGQGEGRQPAPRYPARARTAGQEGTVIVRFRVSEQGRVTEAAPAVGSPWPMLNDEAVRTVRESWRFRPGPVRVCDVAIRFELAR